MDDGPYDLYFGTMKIGVVTPTDGDFPSLWGSLAIDPSLSARPTGEAARLLEFLELNREGIRLLDLQDEGDTSRERERTQQAAAAELAERFGDLIESDRWHLVDARGAVRKILCPILRWDGEIVWHWNPDVP